MAFYNYLIVLITLSAAFAYINRRFIKMPFVIGLFTLSTLLSLAVLVAKPFYNRPFQRMVDLINTTDISRFILEIFLAFLLFAGALQTNWVSLRRNIKPISLLAIGGVIFSTIIIGGAFYYAAKLMHIDVPLIYCFIFGALISPTDPIAVLGILKEAKVPEKIESVIVGESLFNDGIGVVIFLALIEMLQPGNTDFTLSRFSLLFLQEAVGGIGAGLAAGFLLHYLIKTIDHYETETLITIAFVMAVYALCQYLHVSGPLAMVVMGIMAGNFKTDEAMSDTTQQFVTHFWELLDVIFNAVLFILIAFVLIIIDLKMQYLLLGALAIIINLLARALIVRFSRKAFKKSFNFTKNESRVLVWGGLRGGLSLALVLSLPESKYREILLVATYTIVVFSIMVQGLTIGRFSKKILQDKE